MRNRKDSNLHGDGVLFTNSYAVRHHLANRRNAQDPSNRVLFLAAHQVDGVLAQYPAEGLGHESRHRIHRIRFDPRLDRCISNAKYFTAKIQKRIIASFKGRICIINYSFAIFISIKFFYYLF